MRRYYDYITDMDGLKRTISLSYTINLNNAMYCTCGIYL